MRRRVFYGARGQRCLGAAHPRRFFSRLQTRPTFVQCRAAALDREAKPNTPRPVLLLWVKLRNVRQFDGRGSSPRGRFIRDQQSGASLGHRLRADQAPALVHRQIAASRGDHETGPAHLALSRGQRYTWIFLGRAFAPRT